MVVITFPGGGNIGKERWRDRETKITTETSLLEEQDNALISESKESFS